MVQGVLDTLGDDWTLKRMVLITKTSMSSRRLGITCYRAVTAASAARWEALVVCIRV